MDLNRASHLHNIGTFWLTAIMLAILAWPLVFPKVTPAEPTGTNSSTAKPLSAGGEPVHWVMPMVVALALLSAAALQLKAARVNKAELKSGASQMFITQGIRLMIREGRYLSASYTRLAFDDPANSRLPLSQTSLPAEKEGEKWTHTDIMLYSLRGRFFDFSDRLKRMHDELGWPHDAEFVAISELTIMPELIRRITQQVALLTGKVPSDLVGLL
jgi:hypothetical protein